MERSLRGAMLFTLVLGTCLAVGPAAGATSGTFVVCNAAGSPTPSGTFTYTLSAPAGDGGTIVQTIAVGACSPKIFYPVGTPLLVTETVPTGYAVTSIKLSGGSQSTLGQIVLSIGQAAVTIGSGDALLTYTTKAPGVARPPCIVPHVIGLTLGATRTLVTHAHCRVGSVTSTYSSRIPRGGVTSVRPRAGTHLAYHAPVRLTVSRGPRP